VRVRGGRQRDPVVDAAIRDATVALLVEIGYARLTIDEVARRAGVSRPTVYRRYSTKPDLVHHCVFPDNGMQSTVPSTGDLHADVAALVALVVDAIARPEAVAALSGLMADEPTNPDTRLRQYGRLELPARASFAQRIAAARSAGQVTTDIDPDVVMDALIGATFWRASHTTARTRRRLQADLTAMVLQLLGAALPHH
jgi:AcrR family transcriptional regulator